MTTATLATKTIRPWPALWALVIGFFMIMIDTTIVSVASPAILAELRTDISAVIWVTSAYLLAYAVPILITGRLGDRFGPKNIYLIGLVIFTAASLWCGLSSSITMLIIARTVQGLGAALMTPQTMAVITRIFPADKRGAALGVWGSVAGVAAIVGPILGGVLVDGLGWQWIFFFNIPLGVIAFILAARLVPDLEKHSHRFDLVGMFLSAVGMFLIVFGIQEGSSYEWGTIAGPITVPGLIIAGVVVFAAFVVWQHYTRNEPLLPLGLFRDRNFSLASAAIATVGFVITCMTTPLIFYLQLVRGLTPTQSALMLVPMALILAVLSPQVGKLGDRINPRTLALTGLILLAVGLVWYSALMNSATTSLWILLLPSALIGFASTAIWAPISTTATRNLPRDQAGAGSGIYNTTRQIGAVLGSASIAALIQGRLTATLPATSSSSSAVSDFSLNGALPADLHTGFAAAMAQSMLLPAAVALLGALIVAFFTSPNQTNRTMSNGNGH